MAFCWPWYDCAEPKLLRALLRTTTRCADVQKDLAIAKRSNDPANHNRDRRESVALTGRTSKKHLAFLGQEPGLTIDVEEVERGLAVLALGDWGQATQMSGTAS